jgi:ATP-binding cassette subfamily B protein
LQIIKFLFSSKRNTLAVFAILCLLVIQVYSDLSLPQYTSNIVDVGIMQGGVEDAVPNQIRQESLDDLKMFMPEADEKLVSAAYEKDADGTLSLAFERSEDPERLAELNEAFTLPMLLLYAAQSGELSSSEVDMDQLRQGYKAGFIQKEDLLDMRAQAEEKVSELGDLMTETAAVAYVRAEYEALGLDMEEIQTDYMWHTGFIMLGYTLASILSAIIICYIAGRVASLTSKELRQQIFYRVLSFSNREMDKFTGASLITRSTNDIQQIQISLVMFMRLVLMAPMMGLGGVYMVARTKTGMSWIVAVAVGILLMVILVLLKVTMPRFKMLQTLVDKLNLVSREILTGLPVIRAFCREKFESERFDKANKDLLKTQLFTNRAMSMMFPFMMLVMNGIGVTIVWFGGKYMDAGNLQVGDMMAFITYTIQIVMSFMMLSMISVMLPRANVAAERVADVLRTESSIQDKPASEQVKRESWTGEVTFHDVSFRFPDAEEDVLEHISFTARPGETTAIIGSTGCGKSTLINLIPRLFDVTAGSITIDGVDIRDMAQHDLRNLLGVVPQKGILFSGDITSNLKFGNAGISDEKMKKAAEIAQAAEFIEAKEDGYASSIAQGGSNVSGGQKQRLSIARAMGKDPCIYIFDDSFSALDYATETALRKAMKENLASATVIVVAQRISTILHANKILVLDEGKIVGMGSHKELLSSCEVYREIATSQLSESELIA